MNAVPRRRSLAIIAVVVLVSALSFVRHPAVAANPPRVSHVVVAGVPGLRWDDLSPSATPALWELVGHSSVAALSVRSAARLTCPADGWLTLGAGNAAEWGLGSAADGCVREPASVEASSGGGFVVAQPLVVEHNRRLAWGAQPGALAESVGCTTAIGSGAAIAAARPVGRVDRYLASLPADPTAVLAFCPLSIVDLGVVHGSGVTRATALAKADADAARMLAHRPDQSLVIIAGLADTDGPSRLHVAIANGPGFTGGWLTSPTTHRSRYVQLIDIAPTALAALGQPRPGKHLTGQTLHRSEDRASDTASTVTSLADSDGQVRAQRDISGRFLLAVGIAEVLALLAAIPLLRRARDGGPRGPRPVPLRWRRVAEGVLTAVALAVPAALAADLAPWWRAAHPGLAFAGAWVTVLIAITAAALVGPARTHTLGTAAAGGTIAAVIVVVDVISGGWLQFNGVGGYLATDGTRYVGVGAIGLGVFLAGWMLTSATLAQSLDRRWRSAAVAVAGCVGVVIVGSPYLGSNAAGAIGLTAGACVATVMASGRWLTPIRLAAAVLTGVSVTAVLATVDALRPAAHRGSLGQFVTAIGDGTAGLAIQRAGTANVMAVVANPLTVPAVASAAIVFYLLSQHWGGLLRLFGLYPAVRATGVGLVIATVLGGAVNGSGLIVAGAAAATVVPLITLSAVRALAHADDRTLAVDPGAAPVLAPSLASASRRIRRSSPSVDVVTSDTGTGGAPPVPVVLA